MNEQAPNAIVRNQGMQPGRSGIMPGLRLHHPPNMMRRPPPPYFNGMNSVPGKSRFPGPPVLPTRTNMPNQPFGWTNVDNVSVPYIMRGTVKFVSVKMVENKLLSKFPKINMDDMNNVGPIYSYYISDNEAKLLSEISKHYNQGTGVKQFSTKDLIVSLQDFEAFYNRAKQHFSNKNIKQVNQMKLPLPVQNRMQDTGNSGILSRVRQPVSVNMPFSASRSDVPLPINITPSVPSIAGVPGLNNLNVPVLPNYKPGLVGANGGISLGQLDNITTVNALEPTEISIPLRIDGGWVQINNTVVPYLLRSGVKFVPLSVIKYAAGLLTDVRINGYKLPVSEEEFEFLNEACKSAGVNFTFSLNTKIIKLELVIRMSHSKVIIHELPEHDPFTHAQWSDEYSSNKSIGGMKPSGPINVITPTGVHAMPPKNPFIHKSQTLEASASKINSSTLPMRKISTMSTDFMRNGAMPRQLQTPSPSISPRVSASMVGSGITSLPSSNSRPSSTQSRSSITPPPSPNFSIKSLHFEGKTVSCLIRKGEKEPLALLEALVRLYFTQCSLLDFQTALEQVLQVRIQQLSDIEEAAFISFYGLKVKSLRCKSIMSFDKFQSFYVQLKYIFANKVDSSSSSASVKQNQKVTSSLFDEKTFTMENNNNKVVKTTSGHVEVPAAVKRSPSSSKEELKDNTNKTVKTEAKDKQHPEDSGKGSIFTENIEEDHARFMNNSTQVNNKETNDKTASGLAVSDDVHSPVNKSNINSDGEKSDSENSKKDDSSLTMNKEQRLSISPNNSSGDDQEQQSLKRKQSAPVHSRKAKFPKRLEDTVAKLKQRSEAQIVNIANN